MMNNEVNSTVNNEVNSTVNSTVNNRNYDDRQLMTVAVMNHSQRMEGWMRLEVFPNDREDNGWLEWLLVYEFWSGGKLTVGLIQRKPGERIESHT